MVAAMCSAPSTMRCVKLCVVTACCPGAGMMNMFGKPCVVMPCRLIDAVLPLLVHRDAAAADDRVSGAPRERRELGLEPGGVDDAVELVLGAVGDHAVLGDPLDARPGSRRASRSGG